MKKLVSFTTFIVLFMVFLVPGILALAIDMIPANDQPGYTRDEKRSIYREKIVTQKFTSQEDNLTAIALSIGNPNLKNKKEIVLTLLDENKSLLRKAVLSGQNIEDGDFVKFVFEPIADSKNKKYEFTLSSSEAGPEEVIYVFPTKDAPDWIENVEFEDEKFEGGLALVTFHRPKSKWEVVKDIYSSLITRVLD